MTEPDLPPQRIRNGAPGSHGHRIRTDFGSAWLSMAATRCQAFPTRFHMRHSRSLCVDTPARPGGNSNPCMQPIPYRIPSSKRRRIQPNQVREFSFRNDRHPCGRHRIPRNPSQSSSTSIRPFLFGLHDRDPITPPGPDPSSRHDFPILSATRWPAADTPGSLSR